MKKFVKIALIVIIALIISGTVAIIGVYNYIDNVGEKLTVDLTEVEEADCIIVLGAGVVGDSPSMALAYRLDRALEIYETGKINKIIVSGDHGQKSYDEVNVMRDYLVKRGVDIENIFMDHAGFSTYDSMYRARDVFQVKSAVIVTQRLHLRRALYIGESLGVKCQGIEAKNATKASTAAQSVREYPARFKAFLQCAILHSKPTFLGEEIPVFGDGTVTEG